MKIEYSNRFLKELKKCPEKIQKVFKVRLMLFVKNKNNPILNYHKLSGKLKDYRSINISGDWRAIFLENKNSVCFLMIGTHSKLYKK